MNSTALWRFLGSEDGGLSLHLRLGLGTTTGGGGGNPSSSILTDESANDLADESGNFLGSSGS